jgi:hypothetical protein
MKGRLAALMHENMGYDSVLLCNITDVSVELAASTLRAAEEE